MTAPKLKWLPERRGWTAYQVAHYIGMSENWLSDNVDNLRKDQNFPMPSPLTGRYDAKLIERWYDAHSGILPAEGKIGGDGDAWQAGLDKMREKRAPSH